MKKLVLFTLIITITITLTTCAQDNKYQGLTKVSINTDSGEILIVLYNETTLHKENFLKLIKEGFYDELLFHRLIKNFMIQGGDPYSRNAAKGELLGHGSPGYTIPAEIDPKFYHKRGAVAAARKGDNVNPTKASSGCQFYIIQGEIFTRSQLEMMVELKMHAPFTEEEIQTYTKDGGSPHLDGEYTVFGEMIEGFDVLDKLMNSPVDAYDRPLNDIKFSIKIIE